MVFHHHLGTIHPKQLVLVWWSVAKLWCEYGISPYFWHYSSKTACIGMMVSHQAMTWIWYFTIILAPFIQNSLGYYKLEYNANVSEAEESNRLQANFLLHQSRESRTLFSSACTFMYIDPLGMARIFYLVWGLISHLPEFDNMTLGLTHSYSTLQLIQVLSADV